MNKYALAYANMHRLSMEATCHVLQEALAVSISSEVPHYKQYIPQSEAWRIYGPDSRDKRFWCIAGMLQHKPSFARF